MQGISHKNICWFFWLAQRMLYFLSCHMFQHSLVIYKLQRAYASFWGPGKFITTTLTIACSSNKVGTGSKARLNITQKTYFNYLIPLIAVHQFCLVLLFCLDSLFLLSAIFSNLLQNYSTYLQYKHANIFFPFLSKVEARHKNTNSARDSCSMLTTS